MQTAQTAIKSVIKPGMSIRDVVREAKVSPSAVLYYLQHRNLSA